MKSRRTSRVPARPPTEVGEDVIHELCNRVHGLAMEIQLALDSEAELSARRRARLESISGRCRELAQLTRRLRGGQPDGRSRPDSMTDA